MREAAEILGCSDSALRKQVIKGNFSSWQYRKTKGGILFNKNVILNRLENKKK